MRVLLLLLLFLALPVNAQTPDAPTSDEPLDAWLAKQAQIESWSAAVVQTRFLRSLARPLESTGEVWFVQPNLFRWQLGEPPRTIAVRSADALTIAYPRLGRAEVYPFGENLDAGWQQALALLEVGFPSDPAAFKARYELLSSELVAVEDEVAEDGTAEDGVKRRLFRLRPAAAEARRLIEEVLLEVSEENFLLLATELTFPDGSRMRNDFSAHEIDPEVEPSLFDLELGEDYEVVSPLGDG